jgi:hypothetical protein
MPVIPAIAHGFDERRCSTPPTRSRRVTHQPIGLSMAPDSRIARRCWPNFAAAARSAAATPETLARTKDPHTFFATLDALGIPHPEISLIAPRDPQGWLAKRIGGSGGAHVVPAEGMTTCAPDCYYQRRVAARAIGVSFLADGTRAFLIGCNEQWTAPGATASFRFGGVLQPAAIAANVAVRLRAVLDPLVRSQARGSEQPRRADRARCFHVIELNPRPGAGLDISTAATRPGSSPPPRACAGELPARFQPPAGDARRLSCTPMMHCASRRARPGLRGSRIVRERARGSRAMRRSAPSSPRPPRRAKRAGSSRHVSRRYDPRSGMTARGSPRSAMHL